MLLRYIWNPYGALIVGALMLALGTASLAGVNLPCSDTTKVMAADQTCTGRRGEVLTFADWQSQDKALKMYTFGLGTVLIAGGAIAFVRRSRKRAAAAAAAA